MPGAAWATLSLIRIGQVRQVKTGSTYLIHRVGADMRRRNEGLILITGSIAGFAPGSLQAAYNAAKAYLNSFSFGR